MKKFRARTIYPISSIPLEEGLIITKDDGEILEVLGKQDADYEQLLEDAFPIDGIICPGFINAHCHLELSHLKGIIPEKKGLAFFIKELQNTRKNNHHKKIEESISQAENEMYNNGIVAVGDICNGTDSLFKKIDSPIYYHSFIELFAFNESKAESTFSEGLKIQKKFEEAGLSCSIVPHAPYSTSTRLIKIISDYAKSCHAITCIHNQECEAENSLYESKSGALVKMLYEFGIDISPFKAKNCSSLSHYYSFFQTASNQMFVHNTFTSDSDIKMVGNKNIFWCLCPNANIYIENQLPKIELFRNAGACMTIGTDSLASNQQLSIWEEIKTIKKQFSRIDLSEILEWATINGARYLGIDGMFGSIEKGKKPGLVAIENNKNPKRLI